MKVGNITDSVRQLSRQRPADTVADRFAAALRQLTLELARRLLPAGITPGYVNALVNHAFVDAAAELSKCGNGRVNRSRIAVLTSLRRAEVQRLLSEGTVPPQTPVLHQPRTERVIAGWMTDKRYIDAHGQPRRLSVAGRRSSFGSLVKSFAGDVPPRAVLKELHRLGVVRESDGYMELLNGGRASRRSAAHSIQDVIDVLLDGLAVAGPDDSRKDSSRLHRVALSADSRLHMTLMHQRASNGTASFLDGLQRSLVTPSKRSRKQRHIQNKLTVTVLIREHRNVYYKKAK